jgi:hypothetical protein
MLKGPQCVYIYLIKVFICVCIYTYNMYTFYNFHRYIVADNFHACYDDDVHLFNHIWDGIVNLRQDGWRCMRAYIYIKDGSMHADAVRR